MTGILWATLGILGGLSLTALGGMASEEIRDRFEHLPHVILYLAARRLDPGQRITVYQGEWLPELAYILKKARARPISRLITGIWYAAGILASADHVARRVQRTPPFEQPEQQEIPPPVQIPPHAGHGTFAAGIARQVAPGAKVSVLKVSITDTGCVSDWPPRRSWT